jgi:hypothetical protein
VQHARFFRYIVCTIQKKERGNLDSGAAAATTPDCDFWYKVDRK